MIHPLLQPVDSSEKRLMNDLLYAELLVEYVQLRLRDTTHRSMGRVTDNVAVADVLRCGGPLPKIPELDPLY